MESTNENKLNADTKARNAGLMIGISGTLYTWTVSRFSIAYMEYYNHKWVAWRETYQKGRKEAISHKIIAGGNTFGYVLKEFQKYMDYILKVR